ncbi:MAG: hypothetical protein IRZ28_22350, partial [Steroidobacteraceae bacterium]|nr:hypothetical protein [Steroidobacteraceae bacterium]
MSKRRHHSSRLGVSRGERYALLPAEILESDAWTALPDYAARTLIALLPEYHGHNNGCLGLTASQARKRGLHHWKLYGGLKVLALAQLIVCTRRGRLENGTKLPSLYAVTWKGIDEPRDGVVYDEGISACPIPRHDWTKWQRPADWRKTCQRIAQEMRGTTKKSVSTLYGYGRSTQCGSDARKVAPHSVDMETRFSAPHSVDTSKTSALPPARRA